MGYPKHWKELAKTAKEKAGWRCSKCGLICLRPGEKPNTTKPRAYNLQVHHWNRDFPSFLIAVIYSSLRSSPVQNSYLNRVKKQSTMIKPI